MWQCNQHQNTHSCNDLFSSENTEFVHFLSMLPNNVLELSPKKRKLLFYLSNGSSPKHQLLYTLINSSWFSSSILEVRDFNLLSFLGCKYLTITGICFKLMCLDVSIIRDKYLTLLTYSQICSITKGTGTFTAFHSHFVLKNVLFIFQKAVSWFQKYNPLIEMKHIWQRVLQTKFPL